MTDFQNQNLLTQPLNQNSGSIQPQATTGQLANQPAFLPQNQMPAPQSLEQNALSGNKQQTQNFMSALNNVGAGGNNAAMTAPRQTGYIPQNLIDPNAAFNSQQVINPNTPQMGSMNMGGVVGGPLTSSTAGMNPASYAIPTSQTNLPQGISAYPSLTGNYGNQVGQMAAQTQQTTPNYSTYQPALTNYSATQGLNTTQPIQYPSLAATSPITSDEDLKTQIKPADGKVQDFLSKINAHNYQYKNPEQDGIGQFTSPMAQELEATDLGKQAVINTPRGKMVNYGRLGAVNLAAVSVVHKEQIKMQEQLNQLQAKLKGK